MTMSDKFVLDGLTVSPSVIETITAIATENVEGVQVYGATNLRRGYGRGIEVGSDDNGEIVIGVHISVDYGKKIHELADRVQKSVFDALKVQIGLERATIDVYVDALNFQE